ncbi:thermonuclease family protein [Peribacillus glennii]|uniref:Nuclease n=1 Tax=Peribacillus glennii TaxID=2303991 RepID=A0A372LCA1_9BACI|nr:thermonuclease family protein [Peribacillus glennii]RFU63469.1 nuclease [Peribacillus glennii]
MHKAFAKYIWLAAILMMLSSCGQPNETANSPQTGQEQTTKKTQAPGNQKQDEFAEKITDENKPKTFSVTVVEVIDGDTVKIKMRDGRKETTRLLLIDTPETVHPTKPVQPFGPEASQFTKELLPPGKNVEVEPGISERDKYGRLLAYFYVDGKSVNKMLIEKGLARVAYVYAPNTKYIDEFRKLQDKVRKKAIGIWSIENYATSDGFEDSNKKPYARSNRDTVENTTASSCENPQIKGNINSRGEKIYHIPSGRHYAITKAERMFCTEAGAKQAGFRKSQR